MSGHQRDAYFFGGIGMGMLVAGDWPMQMFGLAIAAVCLWRLRRAASPEGEQEGNHHG